MSAPVPKFLRDALPPRLTAGDALAWTVQTELPAGTFVFLVLALQRRAPVRYLVGATLAGNAATPSVAVAADGTAAFALTGATTAAWAPGQYAWTAFSQDASGNRAELAQGETRILPNPLGAIPADSRSRDERILANIDALLEGKSLDDVARYKIGTRELDKIPYTDLIKLKGLYEARVRNARRARGERVPDKTIRASFGGWS